MEQDPAGLFRRMHSFDLFCARIGCNCHRFDVHVSPNGNGFLLDTDYLPDLLFIAPNGEVLHRMDREEFGSLRLSSDGFFVCSEKEADRLIFLLPVGLPCNDPFFLSQLFVLFSSSPEDLKRYEEEIRDLVQRLEDEDVEVRIRAERKLVTLGALSWNRVPHPLTDSCSVEQKLRLRRVMKRTGHWRTLAWGKTLWREPEFRFGRFLFRSVFRWRGILIKTPERAGGISSRSGAP